jgi:hypothetical protein
MIDLFFMEPSLVIVCKEQKHEGLCCVIANLHVTAVHAFFPANFPNGCLAEVLAEDTVRLGTLQMLLPAFKGQHDTFVVNTNLTQI